NSDGSVSTESGIVSESGTSFTTITTFEPPVVCRRDDISCGPATSATNSDTAAQDPTSDATAIESEFTTTWTTTNSDGSVETDSGIVSQLGSSLTTITTFPNDQASEYTTTWTTTNSDGSVVTNSGVVSQSGTSLT
ncbi:hypothetical protein MG5_05239, partial [Candida albicans P57072]